MDSGATKTLVMAGLLIGSVIGGYVPSLLGAGFLSIWGVLGSALGAVLGLWLAYRFASA